MKDRFEGEMRRVEEGAPFTDMSSVWNINFNSYFLEMQRLRNEFENYRPGTGASTTRSPYQTPVPQYGYSYKS